MKDDSVYLRHILDAIGKIESYVAVGGADVPLFGMSVTYRPTWRIHADKNRRHV